MDTRFSSTFVSFFDWPKPEPKTRDRMSRLPGRLPGMMMMLVARAMKTLLSAERCGHRHVLETGLDALVDRQHELVVEDPILRRDGDGAVVGIVLLDLLQVLHELGGIE